jgi:hypothetical protein
LEQSVDVPEGLPQDTVQQSDATLAMVRRLGCAIFRDLYDRMHANANEPTNQALDLYLEHCAGDVPRPVCSYAVESRLLGRNQQKIGSNVRSVAAAMFVGDRMWLSSLISNIMHGANNGLFEIVCCSRNIKYDETPMKARSTEGLFDTRGGLPTNFVTQALLVKSQRNDPDEEEAIHLKEGKVCKIFQVRVEFGIVVKYPAGGFLSIAVPILVPLLLADSSAGRAQPC